jgi:hypothetical protein
MASRPEITVVLGLLAEIFPKEFTGRTVELYAEALDDLRSDCLIAGAKLLIRAHERYFPTPAEIRDAAELAAREMSVALPPPPAPPEPEIVRVTAEEADAILVKHGFRRVGGKLVPPPLDDLPRAVGKLRPLGELLADVLPNQY